MASIEGRGREILEAPNFAHVATKLEDGSIHSVVVWQQPENGQITLNTAEGRAWRKAVQKNPDVTITVADQENPYEYVEIRGRVVEDTHDGADEHIDALAKKYLGKDEYPFRQPGEQRVKIAVEPAKVRFQGS